ncbi:glucosamine-6-phosphate deaminase [Pseudoflavitalea sp. X16]|uniref:glucosamine-6-phosphate deaminase n=1 Tax=Paraflavitalea devenefica TaxID=2716334 RepID=UPI00142089AF|nr:glucosamine-6-phosphate deaminase [Paraflavitalea devenefica]NII28470.1 glucosamine-6-phosphate deaminase [Paraflavitalea devenefica]
MIKEFKQDKLLVRTYENRAIMGAEAAREAIAAIQALLQVQQEVNIIFAAAPSQNEFLQALSQAPVHWSRVNAFHMDEYIDLPADAPQGFGNFLRNALLNKVPFRSVHYLQGNHPDIAAECNRYSELLRNHPVDITCMGIGENGHLAFNDPPVADFNDPVLVKKVQLDEACRLQQVHDGCFKQLTEVPTHAITLTIPALMAASDIFCMVPGPTKATAVYNTIHHTIDESVPASILRRHEHAILFTDNLSAGML